MGEPVEVARFLNKWTWDVAKVAKIWLLRFRQRMKEAGQAEHHCLQAERPKSVSRLKETVVTGYLLLDDSVRTKPKGRNWLASLA